MEIYDNTMELSTQHVAFTSLKHDLNIGAANLTDDQSRSETTVSGTDDSQGYIRAGSSDAGRKMSPDNVVMFVRAKILCLVVVIVILWGLLLLPVVIYFVPSVSHYSRSVIIYVRNHNNVWYSCTSGIAMSLVQEYYYSYTYKIPARPACNQVWQGLYMSKME